MVKFFNYGVDNETVNDCLAIIDRAVARLERGLPAVRLMCSRRKIKMATGQSEDRRNVRVTHSMREDIARRWERGELQTSIAAAVGCSLPTVKKLTARMGRTKGTLRVA